MREGRREKHLKCCAVVYRRTINWCLKLHSWGKVVDITQVQGGTADRTEKERVGSLGTIYHPIKRAN